MLDSNRKRVQKLTGAEIWAFIVARVLLGFALGIFAVLYFPRIATLCLASSHPWCLAVPGGWKGSATPWGRTIIHAERPAAGVLT